MCQGRVYGWKSPKTARNRLVPRKHPGALAPTAEQPQQMLRSRHPCRAGKRKRPPPTARRTLLAPLPLGSFWGCRWLPCRCVRACVCSSVCARVELARGLLGCGLPLVGVGLSGFGGRGPRYGSVRPRRAGQWRLVLRLPRAERGMGIVRYLPAALFSALSSSSLSLSRVLPAPPSTSSSPR